MKIDQDLRAAIRSAEKAQPQAASWEVKEQANKAAIADFLKRFPAKAKKVHSLVASIKKAEAAEAAARAALCDQFGLRHYNNAIEFSKCGDGSAQFEKAGGKMPTAIKGLPWKFDAVVAELAAALPNQKKAILKKYGINWD